MMEQNADTILEEIGIDFRDDAEALEIWKLAGADVKGERVHFPRGHVPRDHSAQRATRIHAATRGTPRAASAHRRKKHGIRTRLWLAVRAQPR